MTAPEIAQLTPEEQQHTFLTAIFQDLGGFPDVRLISPDGAVERLALSGVPAIEKLLANGHTEGRNVYVGMATRISNSTAPGAGDKKHLHSTRVLWADVDYKNEGTPKRWSPPSRRFPTPLRCAWHPVAANIFTGCLTSL